MKTSNKILITAGALFTLTTFASIIPIVRDFHAGNGYDEELLRKLEQTPIRVLQVDNTPVEFASRNATLKRLIIKPMPTPETVRITGDTLYVRNLENLSWTLPDLCSYRLDGVEQPLPEKEF